jgi:hypothetical protein
VQVRGRPRQFSHPAIEHPISLKVGDRIAFLGYSLGTDQVRPGDALSLTLYWQALAETQSNYTVFTHLLGPDGRVWGQQDNLPGKGNLPTTGWTQGEYITDPYEIVVNTDAPPGEYQLEVGMYDATTGARLSVTDGAGQSQGDRILLTKPIRVVR